MSRPIEWMSLGRGPAALRRARAINRPMVWLSGLAVLTVVACTQSYDDFDFTGTTTAHGGTGGTTTTSSHSGGTHQGGSTGGTTQGGTGGGTGGTSTGGGGMGGGSVSCGGAACDTSGTGVCCIQQTGQHNGTCHADGNCPPGNTVTHCDGPEDCPGQFCCGIFAAGNYTDLECAAACGSPGRVVICSHDAGVCPGGTNCGDSSHLPNDYQICN